MTMPKAYNPQQGYKFQILYRGYGVEWEHLDYAVSREDRNSLLKEYQIAFHKRGQYKSICLPAKYHEVK
jgi:spore germination protein YaaH